MTLGRRAWLISAVSALGGWALWSCWGRTRAGAAACPPPSSIRYRLEGSIHLGEPLFIEGLVFVSGQLVASTGQYGRSAVYRIDPWSGEERLQAELPDGVFGEGLDFWTGRFLELTWKEGQVFEWDPTFGAPARISGYSREGWGLTHDGTSWIASDGSAALYFLDPVTLKTRTTVQVRDDRGPVNQLNELEFAQGAVYANVFLTDRVVEIDPRSGCVVGELSLTPLRSRFTDDERSRISEDFDAVPNGIAYDPSSGDFYLSGKDWPLIFKLKLENNP